MKAGCHVIDLTHPDKVLFPDDGLTKRDLVDYYRRIADVMVPLIRERALTLHRFPDGIGAEGFYQQQVPDHFPDWIARASLPRADGKTVTRCVCNDAATLAYLAGQACITPHAWLARRDRPHHPDRMVFDLDPSDDDFSVVRMAARVLRGVLDDIGLTGFVMTTGSRGLHVVVPLDAATGFDAVRDFAQRVARAATARAPDHLTTEQRKQRRRGRLYLDIMRNAYGQTAVAPYAVRPRPGAPVAMPLDWGELGNGGLRADRYRIGNAFRRLAQKSDPWRDMARHFASLPNHEDRLGRLAP